MMVAKVLEMTYQADSLVGTITAMEMAMAVIVVVVAIVVVVVMRMREKTDCDWCEIGS